MKTPFSGGCHCGAIRYECAEPPVKAVHCQCRNCQKFSGSGHASNFLVPLDAVTLTGEPQYYEYTADSGNTMRRGFCAECGVPLFSLNSGRPDTMSLRAGSLDDPAGFEPQVVIFSSRAQAWDHMDPALPRFDEKPPG